jgi:hypothetical protein
VAETPKTIGTIIAAAPAKISNTLRAIDQSADRFVILGLSCALMPALPLQ